MTADGGTASLAGVRNPNFRRNGPLALARIYRKHGVPLPEHVRNAVAAMQRLDSGGALLTPQGTDVEYLFPVLIGTPPQKLNVDIDTGSADFWVFSTEMVAEQSENHTLYDPGQSTTSRKLDGATWKIHYGDGSSSGGKVYIDRVDVGNISVADQAVEAANRVSPEFVEDVNSMGVFGLAFGKLNQVRPKQQNTFFDNLLPRLDEPVFTVDLKHNDTGSFNFGSIKPDAYTGDIRYTTVNDTVGWWAFDAPGYAVGDAKNGFTAHHMNAIADTGATLLLLPRAVADDYYSQVGGAKFDPNFGGYIFRCGAALPDLVLQIGETDDVGITVPGEYMLYSPADGVNGGDMDLCFGGLQSNAGMDISVFGDVFLKSTFAVFEAGKEGKAPRLGFAAKKTH
ncbi:aspartic peptidase domain-containing protein [Cercophora newfieldiana]|uniref:Aspartic peptidase domain-containing protein n=1 Tax=Cercophora newfieldiana TaxID=92897 RepID=A0AA40D028_9PEZI|nr:aspartic peptidase domain-containing protein [Cercophora newfieldiana]